MPVWNLAQHPIPEQNENQIIENIIVEPNRDYWDGYWNEFGGKKQTQTLLTSYSTTNEHLEEWGL